MRLPRPACEVVPAKTPAPVAVAAGADGSGRQDTGKGILCGESGADLPLVVGFYPGVIPEGFGTITLLY